MKTRMVSSLVEISLKIEPIFVSYLYGFVGEGEVEVFVGLKHGGSPLKTPSKYPQCLSARKVLEFDSVVTVS